MVLWHTSYIFCSCFQFDFEIVYIQYVSIIVLHPAFVFPVTFTCHLGPNSKPVLSVYMVCSDIC